METTAPYPAAGERLSSYRKPLFVAILGNAIEYYDNALYGLLAVFMAKAFFAFQDPVTALLATYGTFIVSFAVRPVAGLLLGRVADLRGHRFVLILTINLMTLGTVGIGLLPSYDMIGFWAPVLLIMCRALQGIGASAEYTVATSYALERAPIHRHHFVVGWSIAATTLGPLLASLIAIGLTSTYGDAFFSSGAWRIPFLISAPIGLLALYLRTQIADDGLLHSEKPADQRRARVPLFVALRGHWGMVTKVIALGAGQRVGTFCLQTYFVTALLRDGFGGSLAMFASVLMGVIGAPAAILAGRLSDRLGGRHVLVGGYAIYALVTVPLFAVLGVSVPLTLLGIVICSIMNNVVGPALSYTYIMSFPHAVRGAASALNFNVGTVLFGATAPLVATFLVSRTGSETTFGWYMTALCVVSCLTALVAYPKKLDHSPNDGTAPLTA